MKVKILFTILFLLIAATFESLYLTPVISNQAAVNQVNDTASSYSALHSYNVLSQWYWIIYPLIPLVLLWKEIKNVFKKGEVE